jgi:hypothetical protein
MPATATAAPERATMSPEMPGRSTPDQLQERLERERRVRQLARLRESVEIYHALIGRMARLSRELEELAARLPVDVAGDVPFFEEVVPPGPKGV